MSQNEKSLQAQQFEVIKKLEELFLDVPVIEVKLDTETDRPLEGKVTLGGDYSPSELRDGLKRYKKIREVVYSAKGCFDEWGFVRLFMGLESKALDEINLLSALSQTTRPGGLEGKVSDSLIYNAKKAQGYKTSKSASNAGKGNKDKEAYGVMCKWYKEWKEVPCMYGNQERYIEAMIDKTGLGRSTVIRNLREIKS